MAEMTNQKLIPRTVVVGALALGIIGGGYGIANAATGTGSTGSDGGCDGDDPARRRLRHHGGNGLGYGHGPARLRRPALRRDASHR